MNIYYPAGPMAGAGLDYDQHAEPVTVNGGTPLVDPLGLDPCEDRRTAAERVAQHIDRANQNQDAWLLEWYAAQIEIHPHRITEKNFYQLWVGHFPCSGEFTNEAGYQGFIDTIECSLRKAASDG